MLFWVDTWPFRENHASSVKLISKGSTPSLHTPSQSRLQDRTLTKMAEFICATLSLYGFKRSHFMAACADPSIHRFSDVIVLDIFWTSCWANLLSCSVSSDNTQWLLELLLNKMVVPDLFNNRCTVTLDENGTPEQGSVCYFCCGTFCRISALYILHNKCIFIYAILYNNILYIYSILMTHFEGVLWWVLSDGQILYFFTSMLVLSHPFAY